MVVRAAIEDGSDLVVLDPGSAETEFGIRRPALWALIEQREYVAPWEDPVVRAAFDESIVGEPDIHGVCVTAGDKDARLIHPELQVTLTLTTGLTQDALNSLLERTQTRWAESEIIADRVDSLALRVVSAS